MSLFVPSFRESYISMLSGKVILFPIEVFRAKSHKLVKIEQEILDFGMDRLAIEEGAVGRFKVGNRAQKAGLREWDKILESSYT